MADYICKADPDGWFVSEWSFELTGVTLGSLSTLVFEGDVAPTAYTIYLKPMKPDSGIELDKIYLCEREIFTTSKNTFEFTIPMDIASNYPNNSEIQFSVVVIEYSSSGSHKDGLTATYILPENGSTSPTMSWKMSDNTTCMSTYGRFVERLSNITVDLSPQGKYGAGIASIVTTISLGDETIGPFYSTSFSFIPPTSGVPVINSTIVDTRGFVTYSLMNSLSSYEVLNYDGPKITDLTVHRCDSSGNDDVHGEYVKVTFSATGDYLDNKNNISYVLNYKKSSDADWTGIPITGILFPHQVTNNTSIFAADTNHSYDVEVVMEDNHFATVQKTSVSTAFVMMHFAADGLGMAFGKFAEKSGMVEFGVPICDEYGNFVSVSTGSSGIWSYKKWSDGRVDLWGEYAISNVACTAALGSMYRSDVLSMPAFPFTITEPVLVASYESAGYGAFLWATTTVSTTRPPSYYLVRPTSATISSGKIIFHVTGRWDGTVG